MPFIINGQKVNKPIYKGVVLNAMHVWLQNHWTGTPDASASTLSQDGQVVATNLVNNPVPDINGKFPFIDSTAQVSLVDGAVRLSPKVSGTKTNVNYTVFNDDAPLGHYYFKAHLKYSGSLWYDFAIWANAGTAMTVDQLGSSNEFDVLIGIDNVSLGILSSQLKAPYDGWAEWSDIGLFLESDYQAMQARGVTWFDGTTYTRSSINN